MYLWQQNRAIIWCEHEDEISDLLSNPLQFSGGKYQIKIERWNQFVHWDNIQIQVKQSWIGIEGLPINMWNIHVFKTIGKSLGGLLEVAPETKNFNFLRYAKIKVGGLEGGLMDPILEILCQGLRGCIGIFSISSSRKQIKGGTTVGLVTRAVRAEVEAGYYGSGGIGKRSGLGGFNVLQPNKPLFVLGKSKMDDVVELIEKATRTEANKEYLLSAYSDRVGRRNTAELTRQRTSPGSKEGSEGCQAGSATDNHSTTRNSWDFTRNNRSHEGDRLSQYDKSGVKNNMIHEELWVDKTWIKSPFFTGLGPIKMKASNGNKSEVGQAFLNYNGYINRRRVGQAQTVKMRAPEVLIQEEWA